MPAPLRVARAARGALVLLTGVAFAAGALGWSPSSAAPAPAPGGTPTAVAAKDPSAPKIPSRYAKQKISWTTCSFDRQVKKSYPKAPTTRCAKVKVPMDWKHPTAHPDITLAIAYSKATGKSKGLLSTNPGGPGGSGLTLSAALGTYQHRLFSSYDLLGFDPRGFGGSEKLHCYTTRAKIDALPVTSDYRVRDGATHAAEAAEAKLVADACGATTFARYVNTQQTVWDLEFLRSLFGAKKLNYIGYSYGTWLGSWYADSFGKRVGRFVLDSNMEWTASMDANENADAASFQRRRDRMLFPWLARHDDRYHLGGTTAEVARSYEDIRASLSTDGLGWLLDNVVAGELYGDAGFIEIGDLLHELASDGPDPAADRLFQHARAAATDPGVSARIAVQRSRSARASAAAKVDLGALGEVVRCNDSSYRKDVGAYRDRADARTAAYPFLGWANAVPVCAYWKNGAISRTIDLPKVPRMLMVQSEGDPATGYEGAARAHRKASAHTRLLSVDDEGQHGLYIGGPSSCVDKVGDRFIFDGTLPAKDGVCGTGPLPYDRKVYRLSGPVGPKSAPAAAAQPGRTTGSPLQLARRLG